MNGFLFVSYLAILQTFSGSSVNSHQAKYEKLTEQGMAIYKNTAFLFYDTGVCEVYDLKEKRFVFDFGLGSSSNNNHANCASFGVEKGPFGKLPLLYVAECRHPQRCFVECLTDTGAVLLQTICLKRKGADAISQDWIVDKKRKVIYTISRREITGNSGVAIHRINKYRLPKIKEGKLIELTDKDVLDSFDIEFPNMLQGGTIRGNCLYLPTGLHESAGNGVEKERTLIVVNLKTHRIERKIDLTNITKNEPEDCDFYKGKLLLYCGQSGGLCEIPFK